MTYIYQNKLLAMYFSKIMLTFNKLLFTRRNSEWLHPSLFFLQLIYSLWLVARQFYYIKVDLTVKLNVRKQSTDPVFDQVSVRLSDATHRNMNQKDVFLKKTLISDGLVMLISCARLQKLQTNFVSRFWKRI